MEGLVPSHCYHREENEIEKGSAICSARIHCGPSGRLRRADTIRIAVSICLHIQLEQEHSNSSRTALRLKAAFKLGRIADIGIPIGKC
eukprot:6179841-Pleurochrysis_carterae.AAC.1